MAATDNAADASDAWQAHRSDHGALRHRAEATATAEPPKPGIAAASR